jgi:hypothetical protein
MAGTCVRSAKLIVAILIVLRPCISQAQTLTGHFYFGVGVVAEERDPGSTGSPVSYPSHVDPTVMIGGSNAATVPAVTGFVGVWLKPWMGIEGSADIAGAQSFLWDYSYDVNSLNRASARDWVVLGATRLRWCRLVCFEPVAGLGFTLHHVDNVTLRECDLQPHPTCGPSSNGYVSARWVPTAAVGIDVFLKVAHVSIGPTLRLYAIPRDTYLFPGFLEYHGPLGRANATIPSLGVSVRID